MLNKGQTMGFADLHIHTIHSYDGIVTVPALLKYTAERTCLDIIAITDHDSTAALEEARRLAPSYGIEVIPGCEVSTRQGHVLALFIDRPIPAGLSVEDTVIRAGEQGGLCIAAHPTAPGTASLKFDDIWKALQNPQAARFLVGVEAFNGSLVYALNNRSVAERSRRLPLAQVGNSDSHILSTVGQGTTEFSGKSVLDLRNALLSGNTRVVVSNRLSGIHILLEYCFRFVWNRSGWSGGVKRAGEVFSGPLHPARLSSPVAQTAQTRGARRGGC
jgi:predicted metal-dependent phosphoesterase TrpH